MKKFCGSLTILILTFCLIKEQAASEEIKDQNNLIHSPLVADLSEDLNVSGVPAGSRLAPRPAQVAI